MRKSVAKSTKKQCDIQEQFGQWTLPRPNTFTYSAAISACARSRQIDQALHILQLLKEEEQNKDDTVAKMNT